MTEVTSKFVIVTQPDCRYCIDAKKMLQAAGDNYEEVDMNLFLKGFFKALGLTTVPQIWEVYSDKTIPPLLIGGHDALEAWLTGRDYANKVLEEMLGK